MEKKPFVIYTSENTKRTEVKETYTGHLVGCKDLDSSDQFCVEVLILDTLSEEKKQEAAIKVAATKHHLCILSGNTFEFEYIQPSGKVLEVERYTFRTETSSTNEESQEILENYQHG